MLPQAKPASPAGASGFEAVAPGHEAAGFNAVARGHGAAGCEAPPRGSGTLRDVALDRCGKMAIDISGMLDRRREEEV